MLLKSKTSGNNSKAFSCLRTAVLLVALMILSTVLLRYLDRRMWREESRLSLLTRIGNQMAGEAVFMIKGYAMQTIYSPDSKKLLIVYDAGGCHAELWNLVGGQRIGKYKLTKAEWRRCPSHSVVHQIFWSSEEWLMDASYWGPRSNGQSEVQVGDIKTGKVRNVVYRPFTDGCFSQTRLSQDRRYIAYMVCDSLHSAEKERIEVLDLINKKYVWSSQEEGMADFAFSHDGKYVAIQQGKIIRLIDLAKRTGRSKKHETNPTHLSGDDAIVFSGNDRFLSTDTGVYAVPELTKALDIEAEKKVVYSTRRFSDDNKHPIVGKCEFAIVNLETGRRIKKIRNPAIEFDPLEKSNRCEDGGLSLDNKYAFNIVCNKPEVGDSGDYRCRDETIYLWSVENESSLITVRTRRNENIYPAHVSYSPEGRFIAIGADGEIGVWRQGEAAISKGVLPGLNP